MTGVTLIDFFKRKIQCILVCLQLKLNRATQESMLEKDLSSSEKPSEQADAILDVWVKNALFECGCCNIGSFVNALVMQSDLYSYTLKYNRSKKLTKYFIIIWALKSTLR